MCTYRMHGPNGGDIQAEMEVVQCSEEKEPVVSARTIAVCSVPESSPGFYFFPDIESLSFCPSH